jgi:hypothetical protein
MSKYEKLLLKAKNNVDGLSFKEFQTLNRLGTAKGYQVKQFLLMREEETKDA